MLSTSYSQHIIDLMLSSSRLAALAEVNHGLHDTGPARPGRYLRLKANATHYRLTRDGMAYQRSRTLYHSRHVISGYEPY